MIFFDRSVPKSVADAIKQVRDDVRWLEEEFPHGTPDPEWLSEVGRRGWLVVSRDKRIRYRPGEKQAIVENRVGCFCLTQTTNPTRWQFLKLIVSTLDEMERLFAETERPFIYGISKDGQFRRLI